LGFFVRTPAKIVFFPQLVLHLPVRRWYNDATAMPLVSWYSQVFLTGFAADPFPRRPPMTSRGKSPHQELQTHEQE
jgi:hypothetical protein